MQKRYRTNARSSGAPKFASLHWGSKLLSTLLNRNVTEERLAIIVGNSKELKLLGTPAFQTGSKNTGDIIADVIHNLLSSWQCSESIVNMTFDTTASNTGHVTAACASIEKKS